MKRWVVTIRDVAGRVQHVDRFWTRAGAARYALAMRSPLYDVELAKGAEPPVHVLRHVPPTEFARRFR